MFDLLILLKRRQLDEKINQLRSFMTIERPATGWVKAIREGLGMTQAQLGKRIHIRFQNVQKIETSEEKKTITLQTLEKVARGLNCKVFYILIPEKTLEETVEKQIQKKAEEIINSVSHSMILEDQKINPKEMQIQLESIIEDIKKRTNISMIWDDLK